MDQQADDSPKGQATVWTRYRRGGFIAFGAIQFVDSYTVSHPLGATVLRQTVDAAVHLHCNVGFESLAGGAVSAYGIDAAHATSPSNNSAVLNQFGLRYSRRELGLQASYRF